MTRIESRMRVRASSSHRFFVLIVSLCLTAILMAFAPAAAGQMTEKALYQFGGNNNGAVSGLVRDAAGNSYGTTLVGGAGVSGTVFKVDPSGNETILYSFSGNPIGVGDGAQPMGGLILDSAGNLYGTTANGGGPHGAGTVFKVSPTGALTNLAVFNNVFPQNGASPQAGLLMDSAGNLYGTTFSGGTSGNGTVFKLAPSGTLTVLYSFTGAAGDGANPESALVIDSAGNLYGTTLQGGTNGVGAVFKLNSAGQETVLHSFTGTSGDGANPQAALVIDSAGNLYGTTLYGGANGKGIAFKLNSAGNETILHTFTGTSGDGANPQATLVIDSASNLYGTTLQGGKSGDGIIFKLDPTATETVLYSFKGKNGDGAQPQASLSLDSAGNLYGTTWLGGASGGGTVFKLDPTDHETVLFSFAGINGDGAGVISGLFMDSAGNLYGTASRGGTTVGNCDMCGLIFQVSPTGTETVLHYFTGTGGDGANPQAGLIQDSAGILYGTTSDGGTTNAPSSQGVIVTSGYGTVFKLNAAGKVTVLHAFTGGPADGQYPQAGLLEDSAGKFYGTTVTGGADEFGTVFKVGPAGHETLVHSFASTSDGQYPEAGLVIDSAGNVYGTTTQGSTSDGTVFKVGPAGHETVLGTFTGTNGSTPKAPLIMDSAGNLYGTASLGGISNETTCFEGCGTIFKLAPNGTLTVLYEFTGASGDGIDPQAPLLMDSAGNLYGTTAGGGTAGFGTVFKLAPNGQETILYSFTNTNGDGAGPTAGLIMDSVGNLYGTTSGGGSKTGICLTQGGCGTVFVLSPTAP